ncbi:SET domain-containing protein [Trametes sanguinea]|nr:SET domain-containing protein [Trametes sanguinea]
MSEQEPQIIAAFKAWLIQNGARIHPDVLFEPGNDVPADTTVVSIPFSLAITPALSKAALESLFERAGATAPGLRELSERQLVCTYLSMHWIAEPSSSQGALQHGPYINMLPSPEKLRTPLHFSPAELEAFRGSNLFGATLDRRRDWEAEWEQCKTIVNAANPSWGTAFTWERYLTASTYLSSRAFPSTVLSEAPTLVTTSSSYPVLLPGIDALNHARGHPVSWLVSSGNASSTPSAESTISLVIHAATPRGAQLLNNYGPKPNSELILGYGFSLPNNPDDTIVLKIGGPSAASASSSQGAGASSPGKWEVGRGARGAEPVWDAVLAAVRAQGGDEDDEEEEGDAIEDELCAADMLAEMAQSLYDRLPPFPPANEAGMRPEVVQMLGHYLEGQRDILQSLVTFARDKEAHALQRAREEGLDIVDEEDEEPED